MNPVFPSSFTHIYHQWGRSTRDPSLDFLLPDVQPPSLPPFSPRLHRHRVPLPLRPTPVPRPRHLTSAPTHQTNFRRPAPRTPAPLDRARAPALLPARVRGGGCWGFWVGGGVALAGEDEDGFGEDADEDGAQGGQAGGDDVVGGLEQGEERED